MDNFLKALELQVKKWVAEALEEHESKNNVKEPAGKR